MKQLRTPEVDDEEKKEGEEGKLRRWVSNLQLESWQLELLITGFSIFLLATSIDQYDTFRDSLRFNKLVVTGNANSIFIAAGVFIVNTVPFALQFFLISLLVHLLLRGFWIGIVGLSSVSNEIDFDKLKLQGPFKKGIPKRVKSLDDLIFYLDQVSSVIFAYTFLLAFSILSVVIVSSFLFATIGVTGYLQTIISNPGLVAILSFTFIFVIIILFLGAVIFFLDTIFFSAFKKSKWFSILYFPIYRFYSVVSLSFVYRSIYYHLVTNFKKKQIISVTLVLLGILFVSYRLKAWDTYTFYPETISESEFIIQKGHYDDERNDNYIRTASIPSKFVDNDYLELFIRYSPKKNDILEFLCPEYKGLVRDPSIFDGMRAGMQSVRDTTQTIDEILGTDADYDVLVKAAIGCIDKVYDIYLDDKLVENAELFFTTHENKGEKGFEVVLDIEALPRGRHVLSVDHLLFSGGPFDNTIVAEKLDMKKFVKISFWKE